MAKSGTINGSVTLNSGKFSFYATWKSEPNTAGNYSDVTVTTYWSTTNIANKFDTVGERSASITINGKTTSISRRFNCNPWPSNPFEIQTVTERVNHNDNGAKSITISARANGAASSWGPSSTSGSSGDCTLSTSITLDTIPRTSYPTLSASTIEMGKSLTITTNRADSSFTHKLWYGWYGDDRYPITDKATVGASYTWTIPTSFADNIPDAESGWGTIWCDTYSGSTLIGSAPVTFTATVPAGNPTCTISEPEDAATINGTKIKDAYGKFVKGKSKLKFKISGTPIYGSPIDVYAATVDGRSYSTSDVTTDVLKTPGKVTISASVKDRRKRPSAVTTREIEVLDYNPPAVDKLSVHRCKKVNGEYIEDEQGKYKGDDELSYVKVTYNLSFTPLNNKNSAGYTLSYKKTTDADYPANPAKNETLPAGVYSVTDGEFVFQADGDSSYDVRIVARDDFGDGQPKSTSASTDFTLMNWGADGKSFGLGKVVEKPGTFEVALESEFRGNVYGKAYGLGTLPIIPDRSDLNTYMSPGCFSVKTNASANTMLNIPKRIVNYTNDDDTNDSAVAGRLIVSSCIGYDGPIEDGNGNEYEYIEQLYLPHEMYYGNHGWIREVVRHGESEVTYGAWNSTSLQAYPVNSVYISYSHVSPARLFGGTWTRITNAFLWATTSGGNIGHTGGKSEVALSIDEIPAHTHGYTVAHTTSGSYAAANTTRYNGDSSMYVGTNYTYSAGGGAAHDNMPPYIQVSVWRRTA